MVYYPFYYAGYKINTDTIEKHSRKISSKILAASALAVCTFVIFKYIDDIYFFRSVLTARTPYCQFNIFEKYGVTFRLISYALAAVMSYAIVVLCPESLKIKSISKLGQRTLSVYAFHYPVIYVLYFGLNLKALVYPYHLYHPSLFIILLSLAITLILSIKPLMDFLNSLSKLPLRLLNQKQAQ